MKLQNRFITVTSYLRQQKLEFKGYLPSPKEECKNEDRSMSTSPICNNSFSYVNKTIYLICQIALQSPLELTGIILSPALVPAWQIKGVEVKIGFAMAHLLQLCWFIPFSSKKDEGRQASADLSCARAQPSAP